MKTPAHISAAFAEALDAKFRAIRVGENDWDPGYRVTVEGGNKYDKLIITSGNHRSVHAFIERTSGGLIKAASWAKPQRGVNGLAIRYYLTADFELALEDADPYGSYLYQRNESVAR